MTADQVDRLLEPAGIDPHPARNVDCPVCGRHPRWCWCPPPWDRTSDLAQLARAARARTALARVTAPRPIR